MSAAHTDVDALDAAGSDSDGTAVSVCTPLHMFHAPAFMSFPTEMYTGDAPAEAITHITSKWDGRAGSCSAQFERAMAFGLNQDGTVWTYSAGCDDSSCYGCEVVDVDTPFNNDLRDKDNFTCFVDDVIEEVGMWGDELDGEYGLFTAPNACCADSTTLKPTDTTLYEASAAHVAAAPVDWPQCVDARVREVLEELRVYNAYCVAFLRKHAESRTVALYPPTQRTRRTKR